MLIYGSLLDIKCTVNNGLRERGREIEFINYSETQVPELKEGQTIRPKSLGCREV